MVFHALDLSAIIQVQSGYLSQIGYSGGGVRVAILDTGIDRNHREFSGIIAACHSEVVGVADCQDDNGHGTHVAGILASHGINEQSTGVATSVSLLIDKVLDNTGAGTFEQIEAGINWAVTNRAQVISMSLGAVEPNSNHANCDGDIPLLTTTINTAVQAGTAVAAAAGNNDAAGIVEAPGCISSTIAVGAVDSGDNLAGFSDTGLAMLDHGVVAPGVCLWSTWPTAITTVQYSPGCTPPTNSSYTRLSGTSMATPVVSGSIALMISRNPSITVAQIKGTLFSTAACVLGACPNQNIGHGRINANFAAIPVLAVVDNNAAGPVAAALDDKSGNMYLADKQANTITVVDSNNKLVATINANAASPVAVTYSDASNEVYVAISAGQILVIDPAKNTISNTLTGFSNPTAILYDPTSQDVYIVDSKFFLSSATVSVLNSQDSITQTISLQPGTFNGITIDTATGELYVENNGNYNIYAINPTSNTIDSTGGICNNPNGIDYSPKTNSLYVSCPFQIIYVLDPSSWANTATITSGVYQDPTGMAYDPANGDIMIADASVVLLIDSTNKVVATDSFRGITSQLAFDSANNEIYVLVPQTIGNWVSSAFILGTIGDFSMSASPSSINVPYGTPATWTITLTRLATLSGTLGFSFYSADTTVSCSVSPTPISLISSASATTTLTCNGSVGSRSVTVTGTNPTVIHSISITLTFAPFSITANPTSVSESAATGVNSAITLTSLNNFAGTVALSVTLPPNAIVGGVTYLYWQWNGCSVSDCSLSQTLNAGATATETLTLWSYSDTPVGSYVVRVTGTSGSFTQSVSVTLTVTSYSGGGGGGGGSLANGVLITMADGSKIPVQNVKVGDRMLGYDPESGHYGTAIVTATKTVNTNNELIIHMENGPVLKTDFSKTEVLWTKTVDGRVLWLPVTQLNPGDSLFTQGGWIKVTSIDFINGQYVMYDITATMAYFANGYLDPPHPS